MSWLIDVWHAPLAPIVIFVFVPILLFAGIYCAPNINAKRCCVVLGFMLSIIYAIYVLFVRRENALAIVTTLSQELGPILAIGFAKRTGNPSRAVIDTGGEYLVQLAVFLTGVIWLAVIMLAKMFGDGSPPQKWDVIIGIPILFALIMSALFHGFDINSPTLLRGSQLSAHRKSPDLNCLTAFRFLFGIYAVLLSVQPQG